MLINLPQNLNKRETHLFLVNRPQGGCKTVWEMTKHMSNTCNRYALRICYQVKPGSTTYVYRIYFVASHKFYMHFLKWVPKNMRTGESEKGGLNLQQYPGFKYWFAMHTCCYSL